MTDRTRAEFEAALERRLARHAAIQPTPPDAAGIAREVMARRGRMLMPELFAARPAGWPAMRVAIAMGLLLLAALATLWLVAVGGQRRQGIVEVVPPSASPGPLREALRGSWLADTGPLPNLGAAGPRLRLVVDDDGRAMHLETGSTGVQVMHGTVTAHGGGVMSVTTDRAGLGCHEGDVGRYQTAIAPDGVTATLSSEDDGCPTRVEALTRTWWRSLDRPNTGGRGVIALFQPGVLVTLPAGRLDATTYRDAIAVGNDAGTLYAIKDPWGLSEPCSTSGGD